MANLLSQEEVDALLGGLSQEGLLDGEPEAARPTPHAPEALKVAAYDFRRPNRVSKDQLRFLQTIHESFGREYGAALSGYLRSMVDIEIISVDQLTYGEFVLSLPGSTSLFLFSMAPLDGQAVIEANPGLILSIIDRLFGGSGKQLDLARDLTNIEVAVMTKLVQRGLKALGSSWEHIVACTPQMESLEKNPQMMQILPNSETVILLSLELRIGKTSGILSLCYPFLMLESIIPSIADKQALARGKKRTVAEAPHWIAQRVSDSALDVRVELGRTTLTVGEFLRLRPGDVLKLPRRVSEPVDLLVGGVMKANARAGLRGRHRVARIESMLEEGEAAHVA